MTIIVGPRYENDIDLEGPDDEEANAPGTRLVWNKDDDNNNGVPDYLEIDGNVAGEDDLVELKFNRYVRVR